MEPKKPSYRRAYRLVATKPEKSEGPRLGGILVKDYFPVIGSAVTIIGVVASLTVGYLNTQNEARTTALESDRKLLNDQFVDVQNRLSKTENPSERVNAVYSLVEMAQRADPRLRDAKDGAELAERLDMPAAWVGRLYIGGRTLRPCTAAYPYFKPAVLRLSSVLLLEPEQAVRDAAERGAETLARFSRREIQGLVWDDLEKLEPSRSALPMTRFLFETLGQANRDGWKEWRGSLARFVGTAQAIGLTKTGPAIQVPPMERADWPTPTSQRRKARMARWLSASTIKAKGLEPMWTEPSYIWQLLEALCPLLPSRKAQALDVLLDAADEDGFATDVALQRQIVASSAAGAWPVAWLAQQRELRLQTARFLSTRNALAAALRSENIDDPFYRGLSKTLLLSGNSKTAAGTVNPIANTVDRLRARFEIDLRGCALPGANLFGVLLPGVRLDGAELTAVNLNGALLLGARMPSANLTEASFMVADFSFADLTDARFPGAVGTSARFADADLSYAQFPGAALRKAEFMNVRLTNAEFPKANVMEEALPWLKGAITKPEKECYVYPIGETAPRMPLR